MFLVFWVILVPSEIDVFDEVGSNCWFSQINSDTWLYPLIHLIIPVPCVQNFKAPDSEEGEASEGMEPSPSRSSRYTGLITTLVKHDHDPLQKVNYKTRADRTEKARKRGIEEGIEKFEIGKRESAEKIKVQDTLIKEVAVIKRLTVYGHSIWPIVGEKYLFNF